MADKSQTPPTPSKRVTFKVSTRQRSDFEHPLAAYLFDARGELIARVEIRDGQLELPLPRGELGRMRVFIAPAEDNLDPKTATPAMMARLGAYEPVLQAGGQLIERIERCAGGWGQQRFALVEIQLGQGHGGAHAQACQLRCAARIGN